MGNPRDGYHLRWGQRRRKEELQSAQTEKDAKVAEGWLERAKPRWGVACSSAGVTQSPWGRPTEHRSQRWSADGKGTMVALKMAVRSPLVRRARNVPAAMSRRCAVSSSGEAVEELASNHRLPSTSTGEGQDFIQQKETLMRVSRAFHVPLLIG